MPAKKFGLIAKWYLEIPEIQQKILKIIANRIQQIHENSKVNQWRYVPSKDNPVDRASRVWKCKLWWKVFNLRKWTTIFVGIWKYLVSRKGCPDGQWHRCWSEIFFDSKSGTSSVNSINALEKHLHGKTSKR